MPRKLKLYITGVVATGAVALIATTLLFPVDPTIAIASGFEVSRRLRRLGGLAFWIVVTLLASALPVRMPRGTMFAVSISTAHGGHHPRRTHGGCLGWPARHDRDARDSEDAVPWYGTLTNHAGIVLPAVVAGLAMELLGLPRTRPSS